MFQTFEVRSSPDQGVPRLAALRSIMDGIDAFLVPRADVYQGEYVAPCDDRLAWLTGFTGSAGFAVVLREKAGVFVDGRYRLQVRNQVADVYTPVDWPEIQLVDWLQDELPDGGVIGFDPLLHSVAELRGWRKALGDKGFTFEPVANLVDQVWEDRPAPPDAPFVEHPLEFAGESSADKCARLVSAISDGCFVLTQPDSIAWLLNIRGRDIERNPVPHAFAVLHADGSVDLFARQGKADGVHLGERVRIHDEAAFESALRDLPNPVRLDPKTCPARFATVLAEADRMILHTPDPCLIPKACKNDVEIAGSRAAHLRDATAMVRFLSWLDANAPKGGLTEIDVVTALEGFRRDTNQLLDISFETISGAGPNGAIVHYRVSEESNRPVQTGQLMLVDSGGQYADGTTDITRTIAVGDVGADERACYTRVLQGMIAVSRCRFPRGVGGHHLDALARYPLWTAGMDYDHGTGHGVGAYLSVHEGPQSLARRNTVDFQEGMILSNEPGYYRAGAFGIRIENLIVTIKAPVMEGADDRDMLAFETLTYVPFDRRLIVTDMLSRAEHEWIDAYHQACLDKVGSSVDGADLTWLRSACAPL